MLKLISIIYLQTVVRSESAGETLVNGAAVSVAALRHGDELTVGGRTLRWEYNDPNKPRPLAPQPGTKWMQIYKHYFYYITFIK